MTRPGTAADILHMNVSSFRMQNDARSPQAYIAGDTIYVSLILGRSTKVGNRPTKRQVRRNPRDRHSATYNPGRMILTSAMDQSPRSWTSFCSTMTTTLPRACPPPT